MPQPTRPAADSAEGHRCAPGRQRHQHHANSGRDAAICAAPCRDAGSSPIRPEIRPTRRTTARGRAPVQATPPATSTTATPPSTEPTYHRSGRNRQARCVSAERRTTAALTDRRADHRRAASLRYLLVSPSRCSPAFGANGKAIQRRYPCGSGLLSFCGDELTSKPSAPRWRPGACSRAPVSSAPSPAPRHIPAATRAASWP